MIQKILHSIRWCVSYVPGGMLLIRPALGFMAWKHDRRCRMLLQRDGLGVCGLVHRLLSAAHVRYFADFGTLLGLIRENGLIAHDLDIDFSIPVEESLGRVFSALSAHDFKLVRGFSLNGELVEITFDHGGVWVDFFKCHNIGNRYGHYQFCPQYDDRTGTYKGVTAHERVRPRLQGVEVKSFGKLEKFEISIPANAVEILSALYGTWQIPDSKTDFCAKEAPTQYRDILDGCEMLDADAVRRALAEC